MPPSCVREIGIFTRCALCWTSGLHRNVQLTVIVILALVALFIGLRLYSVLGERTGHEQQPILKPADPDARVEPRINQPVAPQPTPAESGDMAFLPTAGP